MLPKRWVITIQPDLIDREILFITAKSAGYIVQNTINNFLIPEGYQKSNTASHYEFITQYEPYIKANGLFIQSCNLKQVAGLELVTYQRVLKELRSIILSK